MNRFKKTRFASKVVIVAIVFVVIYIIADVTMFYVTDLEPSITPYVFGFFGGELTLLAAKRIFTKSKKEEEGIATEENSGDEESVG